MSQRTVKFRAPVIRPTDTAAAPPRSEADVVRRSAESRDKGRPGGRPLGPEPVCKVGLTLTKRHLDALDKLAADHFGDNRSKALKAVLDGQVQL